MIPKGLRGLLGLGIAGLAVAGAGSWGRPGFRIDPRDPASVEKGILEAYRAGRKKVLIPAGVYRLPETAKSAYLEFADMSGLEIDGRGATFLRTDPTKGGLVFDNCRNVTLRGVTLLNETPPFTQGTIAAIDPAGDWYEVVIDKGYPANFDDPRTGVAEPRATLFIPGTRSFKPGTKDCFFGRVERLGADRFRLFFRTDQRLDPKTHPAAVGDKIAFRGRGTIDIALNGCGGMAVDGVTVLAGGGFCIREYGGEGGNRYTYKVTYGPTPRGADRLPLMACNADAFHSSGTRKGPTLENCLFEGMQDDGIPIRGSFALVLEGAGDQVTVCGGSFLRAGDPVLFYDPNGSQVGETVVKTVSPLNGYAPPAPITNARFLRNSQFAKVTLAKAVPVGFQYLISDPAANGSGYVIRNNVIRNHRARGMLLKAEDGLVEGNLIEGSTIAGIVLSPEIWWNEAGYSRNVIIRNNTIRRVGYSTAECCDHQSGALTVSGAGGEPDRIVPVYQDPKAIGVKPGHRRIVIENNVIEDCDGVNLLLAMAGDVTVRNNRFVRAQKGPSRRGLLSGVDPASLVWLFNCEEVRLEGNTATDPGPFAKAYVKAEGNSSRIIGQKEGVVPLR